jgi:hypothetical protein
LRSGFRAQSPKVNGLRFGLGLNRLRFRFELGLAHLSLFTALE